MCNKNQQHQLADARLRHLNALRALTRGTSASIQLTDGQTVVASTVIATDSGLENLLVENLQTPLGVLQQATLRGSNIESIQVVLPPKPKPPSPQPETNSRKIAASSQ